MGAIQNQQLRAPAPAWSGIMVQEIRNRHQSHDDWLCSPGFYRIWHHQRQNHIPKENLTVPQQRCTQKRLWQYHSGIQNTLCVIRLGQQGFTSDRLRVFRIEWCTNCQRVSCWWECYGEEKSWYGLLRTYCSWPFWLCHPQLPIQLRQIPSRYERDWLNDHVCSWWAWSCQHVRRAQVAQTAKSHWRAVGHAVHWCSRQQIGYRGLSRLSYFWGTQGWQSILRQTTGFGWCLYPRPLLLCGRLVPHQKPGQLRNWLHEIYRSPGIWRHLSRHSWTFAGTAGFLLGFCTPHFCIRTALLWRHWQLRRGYWFKLQRIKRKERHHQLPNLRHHLW